MPSLSETTDHDLLRVGLITIASVERYGRVLGGAECGILDPDHRWSRPRDDVDDEPTYQVCETCGAVRRSAWGIVAETGHEVSLRPMADERMAAAWPTRRRAALPGTA